MPPGITALVDFVKDGWKTAHGGFWHRSGHRTGVIGLSIIMAAMLLYYYLMVAAGLGLLSIVYLVVLAVSGLGGLVLTLTNPRYH